MGKYFWNFENYEHLIWNNLQKIFLSEKVRCKASYMKKKEKEYGIQVIAYLGQSIQRMYRIGWLK